MIPRRDDGLLVRVCYLRGDLPSLANTSSPPSSSARSVRLRAKERMCANGIVLCHEDHCPYAKDYAAKLEASGLVDRLLAPPQHAALRCP